MSDYPKNMENPWTEVIARLVLAAHREPKNSEEILIKTMEELGELSSEFIKKKGLTHKPYDPQELLNEAADVFICITSLVAHLAEEEPGDFDMYRFIEAIHNKINAWEIKVTKYKTLESKTNES